MFAVFAMLSPAFGANAEKAALKKLRAAAAHFGAAAMDADGLKTAATVHGPTSNFTTEVRTDTDRNLFFRQVHDEQQSLLGIYLYKQLWCQH